MPSNIVTKAKLIEYLGLEPGTADPSRENLVRIAVNAFLEKICSRLFIADDSDRVEVKNILGDYQTVLLVDNPPINSFVSLQSGRTSLTLVSTTSYVTEDAAGIIRKVSGFWTKGIATYTITYRGGEVPDDVVEVGLSIAARNIMKLRHGRHGLKSRSSGQFGAVEIHQQDLEPYEKGVLDLYTLTRF